MPKYNRIINNRGLVDPHTAVSNEYNQASGGQKVLNVGPCLLPIPTASGFTCTPTDATGLPAIGKNIAVYNNGNSVGSITLGTDGTVTSLDPGATNANGQAGIPCPPGEWTYISMGAQQFVIASANTLLVYLVEDHTHLTIESP